MEVLDEIREIELQLHASEVHSDKQRLGALLHESFLESGLLGKRYGRSDIIEQFLSDQEQEAIRSQDFAIAMIFKVVILLIYRSAHVLPNGALTGHANRSSLWVHAVASWQLRFHEGSPTEAFDANYT